MFDDHPHRPLPHLPRVSGSCWHDSILSNSGVSRKPGAVHFSFTHKEPAAEGINGYFDPIDRAIYVRPTLAVNQRAKTLAHELGHAQLGHGTDEAASVSRANCEVAAETVAYIVSNAFGVDTAEYSYGYIVGWTRDRKERQAIMTAASRVARDIVAALDRVDDEPVSPG